MSIEVIFDGQAYFMDDQHKWYDAKTFMAVNASLVHKLDELVKPQLEQLDSQITDFEQCLSLAQKAKAVENFERAYKLVNKALELKPNSYSAIVFKSSVLRSLQKPQEALDFTAPYVKQGGSAIRTTRAAAMCDLKRYEEAKKEIAVALAISSSEEAFSVVRRIKAVRPDLYAQQHPPAPSKADF